MAEGLLQCVGSSLFLKKTYGVGYQLTIEKRKARKDGNGAQHSASDASTDESLKEIVTGAVKEASLLTNVGTEMSFQLPIAGASKFGPMFDGLDEKVEEKVISSYGVSLTTLEEVFLLVARGDSAEHTALASSKRVEGVEGIAVDADKSVRSRMDLEKEGLFFRHLGALFKKRAAFFRRDKKAWCWYV